MASNPDGDAIMWVFDRLMKRPEKRKLIIVCSDGAPSGGGRGDEYSYTRKVVKAIEQESPVDIVGIGIMDTNVARIYKENYTIDKASELERALLSVIENKLK
jgi:cobalamin biosynthesis protein CobT